MTKKEEILAFLSEKKTEFFTDYQLVKRVLFGSFTRNEETEKSDIDLMFENTLATYFYSKLNEI